MRVLRVHVRAGEQASFRKQAPPSWARILCSLDLWAERAPLLSPQWLGALLNLLPFTHLAIGCVALL